MKAWIFHFSKAIDIISTGHKKIAQLLIHNGADFTIKDKDGKTASETATEKGIPRSWKNLFWKFCLLWFIYRWIVCIRIGSTDLARVLQENVAQKGNTNSFKLNLFKRNWKFFVSNKKRAIPIRIYRSSQLVFWAGNRFPTLNFHGWWVKFKQFDYIIPSIIFSQEHLKMFA